MSAWQDALVRSGRRCADVFREALVETARFPNAQLLWAQFVEVHPEFALVYARAVAGSDPALAEQARPYFDLWWERRGSVAVVAVTPAEIEDFHVLAGAFADSA